MKYKIKIKWFKGIMGHYEVGLYRNGRFQAAIVPLGSVDGNSTFWTARMAIAAAYRFRKELNIWKCPIWICDVADGYHYKRPWKLLSGGV